MIPSRCARDRAKLPLPRENQVSEDRRREVHRRLRTFGQRRQRGTKISGSPCPSGRPAAHESRVPQQERRADEQREHQVGFTQTAHFQALGERGERRSGGKCAQARQKQPPVAVQQNDDEQQRDRARQPNCIRIDAAAEPADQSDRPALKRRTGAHEKGVPLLRGNDPVSRRGHFHPDQRPARFFAPNAHVGQP